MALSETKQAVVEDAVENWTTHWQEYVSEICERTGLTLTEFLLWRLLSHFYEVDRRPPIISKELLEKQEKVTDAMLEEIRDGDDWKDG